MADNGGVHYINTTVIRQIFSFPLSGRKTKAENSCGFPIPVREACLRTRNTAKLFHSCELCRSYHQVMEAEQCMLEETFENHAVWLLAQRRVILDQVAQDLLQLSFEYPQGWILQNLTGQIARMSAYHHREYFFPNINPEFLLWPVVSMASCPLCTSRKSLGLSSLYCLLIKMNYDHLFHHFIRFSALLLHF